MPGIWNWKGRGREVRATWRQAVGVVIVPSFDHPTQSDQATHALIVVAARAAGRGAPVPVGTTKADAEEAKAVASARRSRLNWRMFLGRVGC
jgi:hypothetical protein